MFMALSSLRSVAAPPDEPPSVDDLMATTCSAEGASVSAGPSPSTGISTECEQEASEGGCWRERRKRSPASVVPSRIVCLQSGHCADSPLCTIQPLMQVEWKMCAHGSLQHSVATGSGVGGGASRGRADQGGRRGHASSALVADVRMGAAGAYTVRRSLTATSARQMAHASPTKSSSHLPASSIKNGCR